MKNKIFGIIKQYAVVIVLIVLIFVLSEMSDNFFTLTNFVTIFRQISMTAIIGVGMIAVILCGNIDLSVGSIMSFVGVLVVKLVVEQGMNPYLACVVGLVVCTLIGVFNGIVVTKFKVAALIATLAMQQILQGASYLLCDGLPIYGIPDSMKWIAKGNVLGIPVPVIIMAVIVIIGGLILSKTYFGRYFYAIGRNVEAAKLSGINTDNIQILSFAASGLLSGLAGIIMVGRIASGQPIAGVGYEMDVISAIVLGGVSVNGGKGNMFGAFIGVLIIGVLSNGLVIIGLSEYWKIVIKGLVLLLAICFDGIQSMQDRKKITLTSLSNNAAAKG